MTPQILQANDHNGNPIRIIKIGGESFEIKSDRAINPEVTSKQSFEVLEGIIKDAKQEYGHPVPGKQS